MSACNTSDRFGWIAKGLHWLTALAIAAMFAIALWMDALPIGLQKLEAYGWHKSLGITILAVTVARLIWRLANPQPRFLGQVSWQRRASIVTHWALYALLLGMPMVGWLMSSAANTPVNVFGVFLLPNLVAPDRELAELFEDVHEAGAVLLLVLLAVHVAAAIKHHAVDKDATLRRMLPGGGS